MGEVQAMVHSLNAPAPVTIISHKDNNNVIAEYNGQRCSAIFNPFVGMYYVDDKYGKLPPEPTRAAPAPKRAPMQHSAPER